MSGRRRAEGSVRAVPGRRGAWQLRWTEDGEGGRVRRSRTVHGTYREACAALEGTLAEVRAREGGSYGGATTVSKVHALWLAADGASLAPGTLRMYGTAWRRLEPRFGRVPVDRLTPLAVQGFLSERDGAGWALAPSTARKCVALLMCLMRTARMYGVVERNPLAGVRWSMPGGGARRDSSTVGSDGLARVCGAFRGSPVEAAVLLMAQGGLRVGESLGVRPGEVSLVPVATASGGSEVAVVRVRRTVGDDGSVQERTKTAGSAANAYVSAPWCARLDALAREAEARGSEWLCDNGRGAPVGGAVLRRLFSEGLRAAGLPAMLPKNLRASFEGSRVYDAGIPVEQVARLMRHADVATTLRHYDRPSDAQLAAVAARAGTS